MTLTINENICFLENSRIVYAATSQDFSTPKETFLTSNGYNTFVNNIGDCTIHPGINSTFAYNDITNSIFYDYKSYTDDLYEKYTAFLSFDSSNPFVHDDILLIIDHDNNKIKIKINTSIRTISGQTDEYENLIYGTLNTPIEVYARDIKILITNYLKNTGKDFYVKIENQKDNTLVLNQTKTGILDGINVVHPSNVIVQNLAGKQGFDNFDYEKEFKPFEENKSIRNIFSCNPRRYQKTLGIDNLDYDEDVFFDDSLSKYSASFYFRKPDEVDYPYSYNEKEINSLSTTINPLETIASLEGKITTEQSLLGIKAHLISSSIDARNRCNKIKDFVEILPDGSFDFIKNDVKEIEPFNDEEYDDLNAVRKNKIIVNYSYNEQIINNIRRSVIDTSSSAESVVSMISNKVLYFSDDDLKATPFYDIEKTNVNIFNNTESYVEIDNKSYSNFGHQRDDYYKKTPDSIAYIGVIE